jgi:hypothetical protein
MVHRRAEMKMKLLHPVIKSTETNMICGHKLRDPLHHTKNARP